jgi:hypothetical protein
VRLISATMIIIKKILIVFDFSQNQKNSPLGKQAILAWRTKTSLGVMKSSLQAKF